MADFSKQWCEINDSEMPWDFDILEVAEQLYPNSWMSYICEGFGFTIIAKDENGDIILGFPNFDWPDYVTNGVIKYKTYKEVIDGSI